MNSNLKGEKEKWPTRSISEMVALEGGGVVAFSGCSGGKSDDDDDVSFYLFSVSTASCVSLLLWCMLWKWKSKNGEKRLVMVSCGLFKREFLWWYEMEKYLMKWRLYLEWFIGEFFLHERDYRFVYNSELCWFMSVRHEAI